MLWFTELIKTSLSSLQVAAVCQSPIGVQGQSLTNLQSADFNCGKLFYWNT